jgi:hypothetical protein
LKKLWSLILTRRKNIFQAIRRFKNDAPLSLELRNDIAQLYTKYKDEIQTWEIYLKNKSITRIVKTSSKEIRIIHDSEKVFDTMRECEAEYNQRRLRNHR